MELAVYLHGIIMPEEIDKIEILEEICSILFKKMDPNTPSDPDNQDIVGGQIAIILNGIKLQSLVRMTEGKRRQLTDELGRIERAGQEFGKSLIEASDETNTHLMIAIKEKFPKAKADHLILIGKRSVALSIWAKQVLDLLIVWKESPEVKRGGPPKKTEKLFAVRLCFQLFDRYRPGEASAYEGGDFNRFCELMYEVATDTSEPHMLRSIKQFFKLGWHERSSDPNGITSV